MKQLLEELVSVPGVQGGMVITRDGIMVAAALGPALKEDVVAALSSSILITLKRALDPAGVELEPDEVILTASKGKLVFVNLGRAFLVAVTRPQLRLNTGLVEIRSIARKIQNRCAIAS